MRARVSATPSKARSVWMQSSVWRWLRWRIFRCDLTGIHCCCWWIGSPRQLKMGRANNSRYLRTYCVASSMSELRIRNWMSLEWLTGRDFWSKKAILWRGSKVCCLIAPCSEVAQHSGRGQYQPYQKARAKDFGVNTLIVLELMPNICSINAEKDCKVLQVYLSQCISPLELNKSSPRTTWVGLSSESLRIQVRPTSLCTLDCTQPGVHITL
jgi:hypothetical protein